ncbi:MAG: hypothetical protein GY839_17360 [candidate division Zixibacteria bacterium]|nr:hypothetical protein [candidate division Zixibacteria bacterium]
MLKKSLFVMIIVVALISISFAGHVIDFDIRMKTNMAMNMDTELIMYYSLEKIRVDMKTSMSMESRSMPEGMEMPVMRMYFICDFNDAYAYFVLPDKAGYTKIAYSELEEFFADMSPELPPQLVGMFGSPDDFTWKSDISAVDDETISGRECHNKQGILEGVNKKIPDDKIRMTVEACLLPDSPLTRELYEINMKFEEITGIDQQNFLNDLSKFMPLFGEQLIAFMEELIPKGSLGMRSKLKLETSGDVLSFKKLMGYDENDSTTWQSYEMFENIYGAPAISEDGMSLFMDMTMEAISIEKKDIDNSLFIIPSDFLEIDDLKKAFTPDLNK